MRFRRSVLTAALVSCLLAWPALAQTPGRGKRLYSNSWALVIGVDRYKDSRIPKLRYAEADAQAVAERLRPLGFPAGQIMRIIGSQATRDGIMKAMERLNRRMGTRDRLFVFAAGHWSTLSRRLGGPHPLRPDRKGTHSQPGPF